MGIFGLGAVQQNMVSNYSQPFRLCNTECTLSEHISACVGKGVASHYFRYTLFLIYHHQGYCESLNYQPENFMYGFFK